MKLLLLAGMAACHALNLNMRVKSDEINLNSQSSEPDESGGESPQFHAKGPKASARDQELSEINGSVLQKSASDKAEITSLSAAASTGLESSLAAHQVLRDDTDYKLSGTDAQKEGQLLNVFLGQISRVDETFDDDGEIAEERFDTDMPRAPPASPEGQRGGTRSPERIKQCKDDQKKVDQKKVYIVH